MMTSISPKQLTDAQFINFDDFTNIQDLLNYESHAIVCTNWDYPSLANGRKENLCVMGALIKLADVPKYLKADKDDRYPFVELGYPKLWSEEEADKLQFNLGQQRETDGIKFHYFIRRYYPYGIGIPRFPVAQSFVFYHELSESIMRNKRVFVDELEDTEVIVEKIHPENTDRHTVRVNRHYLREYLTARKMALAVWTTVQREIDTETKLNPKPGNKDKSTYLHILNPVGASYSSELICKSIIKPYSNIKWSKCVYRLPAQNKPHVPMIIGRNKTSGREILSKKVQGFQAVYFKKDVLGKYIEDRRSVVSSLSKELGRIDYLNQWDLVYGINPMDRLVVWHDKLSRLPYEEQIYWRYFNICPEGGLSEEFSKVFIDGMPTASIPLEKQLLQLRTAINEIFTNKYGYCLFKNNKDEDDDNIQQLHAVIRKGVMALRLQIIALSKLFIESINKPAISQRINNPAGIKGSDGKLLSSLKLMQKYYEQESRTEYSVTETLELVWLLRNKYVHRFSEKSYREAIESSFNRLDPLDVGTVYMSILQRLIRQLSYFRDILV